MDRRQRKTRAAIYSAFIDLLSTKDFSQVTVQEIIDTADVGRATFYAHFETKELLLKALCQELFAHVFETASGDKNAHSHIFDCDAHEDVFFHLFQHLQENDNNILDLLSCRNNELFLSYFKDNLKILAASQLSLFEHRKATELPDSFWIDHIAYTFVETVRWWLENGRRESPEIITRYFYLAV